MYEHRKQKLLPRRQFAKRVFAHGLVAVSALAVALGIGVAGYFWLGKLALVDAVLNAAMILGGMGPVDAMRTSAAKLFASGYALFSGLVFIGVLGVLLAPFGHRILHKLHLDEADETSNRKR
jgi:hypothetical protein